MQKIMIEATMEEAQAVFKILTKADPFGVFTGELVLRIAASAKAAMQEGAANK